MIIGYPWEREVCVSILGPVKIGRCVANVSPSLRCFFGAVLPNAHALSREFMKAFIFKFNLATRFEFL